MESKDHMGLTKLDRLTPLSIIKEKKGVPSQNKTKKKKKECICTMINQTWAVLKIN